jgi:hypothetical protein
VVQRQVASRGKTVLISAMSSPNSTEMMVPLYHRMVRRECHSHQIHGEAPGASGRWTARRFQIGALLAAGVDPATIVVDRDELLVPLRVKPRHPPCSRGARQLRSVAIALAAPAVGELERTYLWT